MYDQIRAGLANCLTETHLPVGKKFRGKVRDIYDQGDQLVLVTTDRLSAFDREIAAIPFKGQVLNLISAFWFDATADIVPNHMLSVPDANTLVAKKCRVFPIEFVVRGYMTGTTATSLWTHYQKGVREYCGNHLSEGLKKNQKLAYPILTPTTKNAVHDKPISPAEIIQEGYMSEAEWTMAADIALKLYLRGVEMAKARGLILVDTKYEMGLDTNGNLTLIDEVHTPDSSRFWLAETYAACFAAAKEPDNIDKEFLRRWFADHCNPYEDKDLPIAPEELVVELSARYIQLYEMITEKKFQFALKGHASVL